MVQIFNKIKKSRGDKRKYRGLILDNELRVLLISDPKTDKAAAALTVNVGYMSDPNGLDGLAHFLEHMLFLGTEKFPIENEYKKFFAEHGGIANAYTTMGKTTHYFDVTPEHLNRALDIFSQLFLAPLFTEDAIVREVQAVNSEYEKNLANDSYRLHQLDKTTSSKDHPYSKFGIGNLQTLVEDPKKNGINVREALLKFHSTYYSSNIMSLVILGKDSLAKLQNTAVKLFGTIKNKRVTLPVWPGHPLGPEQLKKKILAVPITLVNSLRISFRIVDKSQQYKSGPIQYLAYLLDHKSSGSLQYVLGVRVLMFNLKAYYDPHAASQIFYLFDLIINLTEEGLKNVDHVIDFVFQYINLLRKESPRHKKIFNEYAKIRKLGFRFKGKETALKYVVNLVEDLLKYPIEDVLTAEYLLSEFNPKLLSELMDMLTPNNCRIFIFSKHFEKNADQTEKWYGTKYKIEDIPTELIENWKNAEPVEELKLPEKNEFIPSNLDILPDDDSPPPHPSIIHETPFVRVWHKKDDEFLLPKLNLIMDITRHSTPFANLNPIASYYVFMYVGLVNSALFVYLCDANLAGLKCYIMSHSSGLLVKIEGFHDKQENFLDKVLNKLIKLDIRGKYYKFVKEHEFSTWFPNKQASHYESVCLRENKWLHRDYSDIQEYVSAEGLERFIQQFFSIMHIECLIHGNANKAAAQKLIEVIERNLPKNMLPSHLQRPCDIMLNDGCNYVYEARNARYKTSCVVFHLQCPPKSTESKMQLELFVKLASEPCFNELRTKEQLGYSVDIRHSYVITGQCVRIEITSLKHPDYVDHKIEEFLLSMKSYLEEMSDEKFERHKQALAALRLEKPKKMKNLTSRYWTEISDQTYCFDRDNIEVESLRKITKDDVIHFYNDHIHPEGAKRRKLAIHVLSTAEGGAGNAGADSEMNDFETLLAVREPTWIEDIESFKSNLSTFPLPQPSAYHKPQGSKAKV
ncbi:insulin-degrading enzyme-like [Cloeon dipterum]|uniref:insulin-degrading enzyme-like n=1 Tax=Cloeon dipterum TaxID=197152 RepID=UPI003220517E